MGRHSPRAYQRGFFPLDKHEIVGTYLVGFGIRPTNSTSRISFEKILTVRRTREHFQSGACTACRAAIQRIALADCNIADPFRRSANGDQPHSSSICLTTVASGRQLPANVWRNWDSGSGQIKNGSIIGSGCPDGVFRVGQQHRPDRSDSLQPRRMAIVSAAAAASDEIVRRWFHLVHSVR